MKESILLSEPFTLLDSTTRIACRLVGYVFWPRQLASRIRRQVSARSFGASALYTVLATITAVALCSSHTKSINKLFHEITNRGQIDMLRSADIDWSGLWFFGLTIAFCTLTIATIVLRWTWICPRTHYPRVRALFNVSLGVAIGRAILASLAVAWFASHMAISMDLETAIRALEAVFMIVYFVVLAGAVHLHATYLTQFASDLSSGQRGRLRAALVVLVILPVIYTTQSFVRPSMPLISVRSPGQATFRVRDGKYAEIDLLFKKRDTGKEAVRLILDGGCLKARLSELGHNRAELTGRLLDGDREVSTVELNTEPKMLTFRVPIEEVKESQINVTTFASSGRTITERTFIPTSVNEAVGILNSVNDQALVLDAFVALGDDDRGHINPEVALRKQPRFADVD